MLWIKVGSVECGKLVDWAACVCATIDYPGPTATWSAMLAPFKCSVNSCPCENFCLLCVCRIGLCARDYARVMVEWCLLDVWEYQCRMRGRRGLTFWFLSLTVHCMWSK